MAPLPMIAGRLINRPLLVSADRAAAIIGVLSGRIGLDEPIAGRLDGKPVRGAPGREPGAYMMHGGVAVLSIIGSLVSRGAWIGADCGFVSYEGIQHQMKAAADDAAATSIVLDLATPGGEVAGAFETAALVREIGRRKKVVAIVNGMAASAGYAIASGANEIVMTETGIAGGIGVLLVHTDISTQLKREGIKPTLVFAGEHKADGNPFEPLPNPVRSDLQKEVDAVHRLFLRTVEAGRGGRLTEQAARATAGRMFFGSAAVKAGLADRLGTFEDVIATLQRPAPPPTRTVAASPIAASAALAGSIVMAPSPPPAPVDPVERMRRAEYDDSAALRAMWPDFAAYCQFLDDAEADPLIRRRDPCPTIQRRS